MRTGRGTPDPRNLALPRVMGGCAPDIGMQTREGATSADAEDRLPKLGESPRVAPGPVGLGERTRGTGHRPSTVPSH